MSPFVLFLLSLIVVFLNAFLARFVASFFVDSRSTNVAGFAFAIGSLAALSRYDDGAWLQLAASAGSITGLTIVWYLFFKRVTANG